MTKLRIRDLCICLLLISSITSSFGRSPVMADELDKEISLTEAEYLKSMEKRHRGQSLKGSTLLGASKNECTNGKGNLPYGEYLKEFAKGPCTPVIVLPGIAGTKLMVNIDCPTLKASEPELFATCGWSTCTPSLFSTSPKSEYSAWVPDIISPITLVALGSKHKSCFAGILGVKWRSDQEKYVIQDIKGVTIQPFGLTESTLSKSRCGFDAISSIMPVLDILTPKKYLLYDSLRVELESRGYRAGLTMQAMPYDWRLSMHKNQVAQKMEKIIEKMNQVTGKKVSIVAHSFGNLNTLNVLSKMSQEKKDRLIKRYMAIAPPYLGSPGVWNMMIGGSNEYSVLHMGITFWVMKRTLATFQGGFDLIPRNSWSMHKNEPWLQSIRKRVADEKGTPFTGSVSDADDIVKKLLPPISSRCYPNTWSGRSVYCDTGMEEFFNMGSIKGQTVHVDNMLESLKSYSYSATPAKLFELDRANTEYSKLANPGVETVLIYSTIKQTPREFHYNDDPRKYTVADDSTFLTPDRQLTGNGDGTVLATSVLYPGFKWAYEFMKGQSGAKPVVFAEACSNYGGVIDQVYQSGKTVTKNQFQGIGCTCNSFSDSACDHVGLISESKVVNYVANSLADNLSANPKLFFDGQPDTKIADFVNTCSLLYI